MGKIKIFVQDFVPIRTALRAVFMGTKSCTKILIFRQDFRAVEDFVTFVMG